ncbi:MAG: hypothetical protein AB9873_16855 [Syntrophobacteraceae bacterium]
MQLSARGTALLVMALSGTMFIAATAGMIAKLEPCYTWYYLFCWWCYILFFEGVLRLKGGRSELFDDPGRFCATLPLSILFWLIFELFNFRLQNWHYSGVPAERWLRWAGYAISFATVLPGLKVTENTLDRFTSVGKVTRKPRERLERVHPALTVLGAFCLVTPLLEPRFFFPLIWVGFIFLLDPLNHRLGAPSLLRDLENGCYRRLFQLPIAGLCCGLLWEAWNFWAGAKWTYTIPFFGFLKVFEMPVLGFLGFLPFSLEAHVMNGTVWAGCRSIARIQSRAVRIVLWAVLIALCILFSTCVFRGIDRWTVRGFRP